MYGKLYIDGNDAFATYGIVVCQGGYDRLVEFPKPKKYATTDWHESNGLEIDGNVMRFDGRNIPINFMCKGDETGFERFIETISEKVSEKTIHEFNFAAISLTCFLRYVSCSNYKQGSKFCTFTVTFAVDEDVFNGYTYSDPTMSKYGDVGNYFNFGHFRQFGLSILGNYKNELIKATNAKEALKLSYENENGIDYDDYDTVTFSQRKSRISFLLQADSWSDLWNRWKALLYNFAYPGKKHLLTIASMPEYLFTVWYDGMNVEQLMSNSKGVMIKFSIDMFTSYEDEETEKTLLVCENGDIFATEDGYLIEI